MNFPCYEKGQRIAVGTTSAATALEGASGHVMAALDVLLYNPGPNDVHVLAGDASALADNTCAPLPAGTMWAYRKGPATHLAAVAIGGAQTILVVAGEGN